MPERKRHPPLAGRRTLTSADFGRRGSHSVPALQWVARLSAGGRRSAAGKAWERAATSIIPKGYQ
jgi:hypothetical protein